MTDHTAERILLAEAMGAKKVEGDYYWPPTYLIERAKAQGAIAFDYIHVSELPDPYTNPADCEAVMDWLDDQGGLLSIVRVKGGGRASYRKACDPRPGKRKHEYAESDSYVDWKHAVCEVAVKVAKSVSSWKTW